MKKLQNHIHLSKTVQPNGEKAPDMRWKTYERLPVPVVIASIDRTLTGQLKNHVLRNSGQIVKFTDFRYTIKVEETPQRSTEENLALLLDMNGELVYLVDHIHPDDGMDHTSAIHPMIANIRPPEAINTLLQYYRVEVELTDAKL